MTSYLSVLPVANFLRLPHPRTGIASLFLPISGHNEVSNDVLHMLEVQAVAPVEARSWFLKGEIISDGKLLVMTPIDLVFLLLPILQAYEDKYENHFRQMDDIFEDAARKIENSVSNDQVSSRDILQFASFQCTKDALQRICDVKEVTPDIIVYRYNPNKVVEYLKKKVTYLTASPIIDGSKTIIRSLAKDGLMEDGNEQLLEVGRIRAACEVLGQYLPTNTRSALFASYDFRALDAHIKTIRAEITAPPESKKQVSAKGTQPSEDKKRKSKASNGVEKLKKANVSGMAKLSKYFTKS
ncbi:Ribonuclease H2, subunit B [Amanita muscaria]